MQFSVEACPESDSRLRTNFSEMGEESQNQELTNWANENLVDSLVRYILDVNGQLFVFENVPARVDQETGEQFFSPATVRRIQEVALSSTTPARLIQASVYEFAA